MVLRHGIFWLDMIIDELGSDPSTLINLQLRKLAAWCSSEITLKRYMSLHYDCL